MGFVDVEILEVDIVEVEFLRLRLLRLSEPAWRPWVSS